MRPRVVIVLASALAVAASAWVLLDGVEGAGDSLDAPATRLADGSDPGLRPVAARAPGRGSVSETPAEERLYGLLSDADASVCGNAAKALERRAGSERSIAGPVVAQWRITPHPKAMTQLMTALLPESAPALVDAALGGHEERRQAAWRVLADADERKVVANAGQLARMVLDARVPLAQRREFLRIMVNRPTVDEGTSREVCATVVTEADASLAVEAMYGLAGDSAHRAALLAAAARAEPEVRAAAVRAMFALLGKHDDVRAACIAALGDADASVHTAALEMLDGVERPTWAAHADARDAATKMLVVVAREGFRERIGAIAVFERFPDADRPADALVSMLGHDDTADQLVGLMTRTPQCTAATLQPALDGTDPAAAARAARVLIARRANDLLTDRLVPWIDSGDPRVAREGALAAGELPVDGIVQLSGSLIRAARAGVEGVAWPACGALGRIVDREPAAREAILAVADDPRNSAQLAVSQFFPELGEAGVTRLIALLDHERRDARRDACLVIFSAVRNGKTGYAGAIPALERLAKGVDLELKRFAQDALDLLQK
jgi:hypothetical protein